MAFRLAFVRVTSQANSTVPFGCEKGFVGLVFRDWVLSAEDNGGVRSSRDVRCRDVWCGFSDS